jgi:hypothetical protein
VSSVEHDHSRSELNACQEYFGELVVTGRDSSKMLEFIEEALDEVSFAVEREIAGPRHLTVCFCWNHGRDASLGESADQRICVVSLVAKQCARVGAFEQGLRASQVVGLSRRQHQFDGIAQGIDEGVDFGRQSTA